jgi:hypothetical protein
LIGRTEKFWINSVDERLQLHRVADDDFSKIIEPIVAALPTHVIYSNYNPDFPAFEYYSYRTMDSSFQLLAHVEDEELMRMFRSEYKYLTPREKLEAYRYEQNTGVDKEVIAAYMRGFQNTYYYQPLNAPIFECHEQLVLFDHHHHCMKRITLNGSLVDSVAISFHMPKKPLRWSERVIQDKSQNHFYTTYERNGYTELHYIGDDGQHTHRMDLYYRYAEEVQIKNGFVYYIYRPFESSQNRYLYKEKIPATDKQ